MNGVCDCILQTFGKKVNDEMWDGHLIFSYLSSLHYTKHPIYRSPSKCIIKKECMNLIILNFCQHLTATAGSFLVMKVHIKMTEYICTRQHQRYAWMLSIS